MDQLLGFHYCIDFGDMRYYAIHKSPNSSSVHHNDSVSIHGPYDYPFLHDHIRGHDCDCCDGIVNLTCRNNHYFLILADRPGLGAVHDDDTGFQTYVLLLFRYLCTL